MYLLFNIFRKIIKKIVYTIMTRPRINAKAAFIRAMNSQKGPFLSFDLSKAQKQVIKKIYELSNIQSLPQLNEKTISVIIPHFNQQKVLKETIESILKQTHQAYEIIIIDDCSDDRELTENIINEYKHISNLHIYYPQEKLYLGGARNFGANKASGSIISFIDSDDIIHPQSLEFINTCFTIYPDTVFMLTGTTAFSNKIPTINNYDTSKIDQYIIEPKELLSNLISSFARNKLSQLDVNKHVKWYNWGGYGINKMFSHHSGALSIRKEALIHINYSTPMNYTFTPYEDLEICTFLQAIYKKSRQIDLPLIFYRRGYSTSKPQEVSKMLSTYTSNTSSTKRKEIFE